MVKYLSEYTRIICALFTIAVVFCSRTAAAQVVPPAVPSENEVREQEARTACGAGDVDKGIKILAELFTRTEDMTYVFNQGRCFQQNGRGREAVVRFREFLRRAGTTDGEAKQEAERFVRELEAELKIAEQTADKPDSAPSAPVDLGMDRGRTWRRTAVGLLIGGGAAVMIGALLSLKVKSLKDDTETYAHRPDVEVRTLNDKVADGNRYQVLQWPAYLLGAAALAGGTACYLVGEDRRGGERVAFAAFVTKQGAQGAVQVRF